MIQGKTDRISAIVLAAGESRRMGGGRQKLLMEFRGRTIVENVVSAAVNSRAHEVVIVTGAHHGQLKELLGDSCKVRLARNSDPTRGMLSSVRRGLEAIDASASGIAVLLGDQPGITAEIIDAVIEAWSRSPAMIAVPKFGERRGHPLVFGVKFKDEIRTKFDDAGLRGLLAAHADAVVEIPLASKAILEDIDTPEDYERLAHGGAEDRFQ